MHRYLESTEIIDWTNAEVRRLAVDLGAGGNAVQTAKRCFDWVRDEVRHSVDRGDTLVTVTASDVLRHRTGFCYAKSHLLAALLRANGIPAGFCYQRLSVDGIGAPFSLHGFNGIFLPDVGWYRADARGNRVGVETCFAPPIESLAYPAKGAGEKLFDGILTQPLPVVIDAMSGAATVQALIQSLPDAE